MFKLKQRSTYLQLQDEKDSHLSPNYNFVKKIVERKIAEVMRIIEDMVYDTEDSRPKSFITCCTLGMSRTEWPTCGALNSINGLQSVDEESRIWNQHPLLKNWVYYADFVSLHKEESNYIYMFEVQWCVPTAAYPEPQVIVSVYFYISANCNYPSHYPVNVSYILEGHQFAHNLNTIFRPKWLYDVFDMKTMMFKTFDF